MPLLATPALETKTPKAKDASRVFIKYSPSEIVAACCVCARARARARVCVCVCVYTHNKYAYKDGRRPYLGLRVSLRDTDAKGEGGGLTRYVCVCVCGCVYTHIHTQQICLPATPALETKTPNAKEASRAFIKFSPSEIVAACCGEWHAMRAVM